MADTFDPYYEWLAIPPEEQPPHHYRLLGLKLFEDKPTIIEHAADRQMGHLRNFQSGRHSALSQKLLNEIAAARVCLLNPQKKAAYDATLREQLQPAEEETSSQERLARELADVVGSATTRTTASRLAKGGPSMLLIGGIAGAVVVVGVVAWSLIGRGKPEPSGGIAGASGTVSAPEGHESIAQGAGPGQASPESNKAPDGRKESTPKKEESKADDHREHRATQREKQGEDKSPPSVLSVPSVVAPSSGSQSSAKAESAEAASSGMSSRSEDPSPKTQNLIPARLPVPDEAALASPLKLAQEVYRDEYDKAQTAAALTALAKKIIEKAGTIEADMPARFVFLRLARDVAGKAGDSQTAFEAIDRLAESFEIDPWEMKAAVLQSAAKLTRKPAERKQFAQEVLMLMKQALEADAFVVAEQMSKLALAEGTKLRDKEIIAAARDGGKQAEQAAKAYEQVAAALATLKTSPDDPAANLTVGRYQCFVKGDWEKGLAFLAKGSDSALKSLALDESKLTASTTTQAQGLHLVVIHISALVLAS